jgi:adenosine deaminase
LRYAYPLRHYLNSGMDVSINTDNRFLHGQACTLTDEYLKAADLSGFLTRTEVLKIVCSGFRNAFLEEEDANQFISHIESQIYSILTRA